MQQILARSVIYHWISDDYYSIQRKRSIIARPPKKTAVRPRETNPETNQYTCSVATDIPMDSMVQLVYVGVVNLFETLGASIFVLLVPCAIRDFRVAR